MSIYVPVWTVYFCVAVWLCYNQAYRYPEFQERFRAILQIWRIQKMNEQKLEKQRQNLVDRGLLSRDEKLYGSITINYMEKLAGRIETWKQGSVAIFTDQQVILTKGFSCEYIHIPYSCIKELGKCNQGFFPIGIVITYENRESGEIVTEKISLGKRKKWLQILSEKTGL